MAQTEESGSEAVPGTAVRRPIRWWPVPLVLLVGIIVEVWAVQRYGRQRQDQNLASAAVALGTLLLLLLWGILLSRMRWKVRLALFAAFVGVVGLAGSLFQIHGVTGDLVPILRWRWSQTSGPAPDPEPISGAKPAQNLPLPTNSYPQFLGPDRTGMLPGPRLARDWKGEPPRLLWRRPMGLGWSGFAIEGTRAITQEQQGVEEAVNCYDLLSGRLVWNHTYPARFQSTLAGEGPRATPTIAGKRVYTLGSTGILKCLELETGRAVWSKNILVENHGRLEEWGMSSSPLVVDDLVVVSAGGRDNRSLVAYRTSDGSFVWGGGSAGADYSSPTLVTLMGIHQIIIFNSGGIFAHEPATGTILWQYHWPGGHPHVSTPIVLPGDRLLISSGYGFGSELVQIARDASGKLTATRIWKSTRLKAKFTDVIYRNGFIYGLDDGVMVCLDAADGAQKWKQGRYGHGQEILVGDLLLMGAESGEILLLDPTPQESRELTRFSALHGKTWNPPALAGPYLVVRNDKEAACYQLPILPP